MIQIGGDSLFKVLSNDMSYAQSRWETRKLCLFYEALSNWNFNRADKWGASANYERANNSRWGPRYQLVWI